jgi:hypothetical protein
MFVESLEGRVLFSGAAARFVTVLDGASEVPPDQSVATGVAKFTLSKDGSTLRYTLKAKKIQNTMGAHIHLAQPGVDGPIVVDLLASGKSKIRKKSASAKGAITAAQLTGPLAGHTLADLVAQMTAGGAYVNVHTDDGIAPADTGPGDFPNGEIRGQITQIVRHTTQGGQTSGSGNQTGGNGGGGGGLMY